MSHFSAELRVAMQAHGVTQITLSAATGIGQSHISRYCRGGHIPAAASLLSIANALPEAERPALVAAWLRDQLPPALAHYAEISQASADIHTSIVHEQPPEPASLLPTIDPALRAKLVRLAALAARHAEIRDIIDALLKLEARHSS